MNTHYSVSAACINTINTTSLFATTFVLPLMQFKLNYDYRYILSSLVYFSEKLDIQI